LLLDRIIKFKCTDLHIRTIVKFLRLGKDGDDGYFYFTQQEWVKFFPKDRKVKLLFKCDNPECGKEYEKTLRNGAAFDENGKTYCSKCRLRKTMLSPEFKALRKEIAINKYGVDDILKAPQVREKIKNTNLKKYNVEHVFQCPEVQQKCKETNREKYGYDYTCQVPEIRKKQDKTRMKNRKENKMSSKTERRLNESIFHGKLQKHISKYVLDIYLEIEGIDVEIDGAGHWLSVVAYKKMSREQFDENERIREKFLLDKGIKTIRFIAPHDNFPDDEMILDLFNQAKKLLDIYNVIRIYLEENNRFKCY
jgi:very-short-patch-repair endonuclease